MAPNPDQHTLRSCWYDARAIITAEMAAVLLPSAITRWRGSRPRQEPSRKSTEGLALAAEVRAHIKNMPASERTVFIRAAVEAGDKLTIAAILHAQHFLSGLDRLAFDNLRRQAAFKFAPVDAAQHEATVKVIQRVENASSNLFMRYIKIIDRPEAKSLSAQKNVKTLAQARKRPAYPRGRGCHVVSETH